MNETHLRFFATTEIATIFVFRKILPFPTCSRQTNPKMKKETFIFFPKCISLEMEHIAVHSIGYYFARYFLKETMQEYISLLNWKTLPFVISFKAKSGNVSHFSCYAHQRCLIYYYFFKCRF